MSAIVEHLDRNGFAVHHAHYTMEEERCMFLMELLVTELPNVRIHTGPPLWNRTNAEKFREKHVVSPLPGPYINEGKYEMEVPREFTRVEDLLKSETLLQVRLGKHVRQVLANGWELKKGVECWHEEFAPFIAGFFDRCSPLVTGQTPIKKRVCALRGNKPELGSIPIFCMTVNTGIPRKLRLFSSCGKYAQL